MLPSTGARSSNLRISRNSQSKSSAHTFTNWRMIIFWVARETHRALTLSFVSAKGKNADYALPTREKTCPQTAVVRYIQPHHFHEVNKLHAELLTCLIEC